MAAQGQIVEVQGVVKAIAADGHTRILKSGDIVQAGERVELADGASVLMMRPDGEMVALDGGRTVLLSEEMLVPRSVDATDAKVEPLNAEAEQVIAALTNNADPFNTLEEAAAGLTGGGPDGGFSAYRLGRIVESISPLSMSGAVTDIASTNLPSALASTSTTAPAGTLTITLSSATNGQAVAEGGSITYTVSTDHAVSGSPLVVTLSNGREVSIPVGASSGSVTVGVRSDDAYSQGPVQQNVSISGTSGGNFEAVTTTGTVSNSVTDNGTVTHVTLDSATNGQAVTEGGSITYTVSTDHAVTGSPLVVTLSNGSQVSIPVGASSGSVTVDVRSDDAYSQGAVQQSVSISGTSGGNFEAVTTAGTVSNSVTDNGTVTNVTLSSATNGQAVAEGGSITYTVSTDHAVTGSPLVVTLSNGREVSIPVGASSGSVTVGVRSDDAYSQGPVQQNVSISGTSGGNFEAVTTTGTVSNSVTDNGTVTHVTLDSATNGQAVAEGGSITYTVSTDHAVSGSPLVVTLSNGREVSIPVGASSGSVTVDVRSDDAYSQGAVQQSVSISGTSGGNFEAVTTAGTVSNSVTDNGTVTNVTLSSATNGQAVAEGGSITYTVSTDHAVSGSPLVVTLSNGREVSIPVGASSGSVTVDVRSDDAYSQGAVQQSVSISGTSGGNFEAVTTAGTVSNSVTDNGTVTNVTLSSATNGQAVAEGGSITYTVSTDHAVSGSPLVVTLSNGREVSIPVGASSGSVTVDVRSDDAYSQGAVQQSVSISGTSGGNFEAVTTTGTVSNSVTDNGTVTHVTLDSATNGQAVTEGGSITYTVSTDHAVSGSPLVVTLSNGREVSIPVGASSGSVTV
ncbi:retention module-containing protein, partial [Laribacter hongkongensis]|uniref:retention module-containing protein n=1 Tax=Laribacter hongkongensis TaxID=168471 RepID=UPI001EFC6221